MKKSKLGAYSFLLFYVKEILKDFELANLIEYVIGLKLNNYNNSYILNFIFIPEILSSIEKINDFPQIYYDMMDWEKMFISKDIENFRKRFSSKTEKAGNLINQCDNWLNTIGFYDNYGESHFKYYMILDNIEFYETPKELNLFRNKKIPL